MTPPRNDHPRAAAVPGRERADGWIRQLDREAIPPSARVLALGDDAVALAPALRARGHEVVAAAAGTCEAALRDVVTTSPNSFDLCLAFGSVEWLRWDRWTLQQVHRALRDGGLLMLAVPNLYDPRRLADPRYVAAKLVKRLGGVGWPAVSRTGPRTYEAARLRGMLEDLGFEPRRWAGAGAPSRGNLPIIGTWLPARHVVAARKPGPSDPRADVSAQRRRFEHEQRRFLALREDWRRRLGASGPAAPLEPERYAGTRVLVLSPHPDDEIIGCGGTLLRLVRAGAKVTVLQATDGSASAALEDASPDVRRTMRLHEAQAVAAAAGFEPTIFWREDNGAFRARDELVGRLRDTLREMRPGLVFTPFVGDIHADHQTLNRILATALEGLPDHGMRVAGYEVWSLAPANLWCDVSSCMRDVERLLLLYETAMKVDDFIHMCSTRNRVHAHTLAGVAGYAEAFFAADPARFREMVTRLPEAGG